MLERKIPYRKCLKLRVSRPHPSFILVIKLRQTGRHFAASRSGCRYNYKRTGGLYIFVSSVTLVAYDMLYVGWISLDGVMIVRRHIYCGKPSFKQINVKLTGILGNNNTSHIKPHVFECSYKPKHFFVIGNTDIPTHFVFFYVYCRHGNDYLGFIGKLTEHFDFTVGAESRKYTGSMMIVEKLSAKLKIQLVVKSVYTVSYMFRL